MFLSSFYRHALTKVFITTDNKSSKSNDQKGSILYRHELKCVTNDDLVDTSERLCHFKEVEKLHT